MRGLPSPLFPSGKAPEGWQVHADTGARGSAGGGVHAASPLWLCDRPAASSASPGRGVQDV